jgi:Protein of unknown function (DUF3592)
MTVQGLVARAIANKAQILRYMYIPQALVGAFLLIAAYYMGHAHFHLIREGIRAPGSVVGHKQEYFQDTSRTSSTLAFMPIVEFQAGEQIVRFEDWRGSSSADSLHDRVTVLYDPAHPSDAVIDRPVWNWLPWAAIAAVGLFLTLVAVKGWLSSIRASFL